MPLKLFHLLIALIALAGLRGAAGALPRGERRALLAYYTNLSNLWMAVYYLLSLTGAPWLEAPALRLALVTSITVTMLVYAFFLAPHYRKRARADRSYHPFTWDSYLLHYAVPALCVLDWALFADKAGLAWPDALWCAVPGLLYGLFIFARARLWGVIPGRRTPWPYHFMNAERLGPGRMIRNCLLLLLAFPALGGFFRWIALIL